MTVPVPTARRNSGPFRSIGKRISYDWSSDDGDSTFTRIEEKGGGGVSKYQMSNKMKRTASIYQHAVYLEKEHADESDPFVYRFLRGIPKSCSTRGC